MLTGASVMAPVFARPSIGAGGVRPVAAAASARSGAPTAGMAVLTGIGLSFHSSNLLRRHLGAKARHDALRWIKLRDGCVRGHRDRERKTRLEAEPNASGFAARRAELLGGMQSRG